MPEIVIQPVNMSAKVVEVLVDGVRIGSFMHHARYCWHADSALRERTGIATCTSPFNTIVEDDIRLALDLEARERRAFAAAWDAEIEDTRISDLAFET